MKQEEISSIESVNNDLLIGYKGSSGLESQVIHADWVPIYGNSYGRFSLRKPVKITVPKSSISYMEN